MCMQQACNAATYTWTGSPDTAAVLTFLVVLPQVLGVPLVKAGSDETKCFSLTPQAISMAMLQL